METGLCLDALVLCVVHSQVCRLHQNNQFPPRYAYCRVPSLVRSNVCFQFQLSTQLRLRGGGVATVPLGHILSSDVEATSSHTSLLDVSPEVIRSNGPNVPGSRCRYSGGSRNYRGTVSTRALSNSQALASGTWGRGLHETSPTTGEGRKTSSQRLIRPVCSRVHSSHA